MKQILNIEIVGREIVALSNYFLFKRLSNVSTESPHLGILFISGSRISNKIPAVSLDFK